MGAYYHVGYWRNNRGGEEKQGPSRLSWTWGGGRGGGVGRAALQVSHKTRREALLFHLCTVVEGIRGRCASLHMFEVPTWAAESSPDTV